MGRVKSFKGIFCKSKLILIGYFIFVFLEDLMEKILNLPKTSELNQFFGGRYSEEVIKKIKNFYFNDFNVENEAKKLENICHVSTLIMYFSSILKECVLIMYSQCCYK